MIHGYNAKHLISKKAVISRQKMRKSIFFWLVIVVVVYLQACQSHLEANQQAAIKEQRLRDAAIYNKQLGLAYLRQSDRPRAKRKLLRALELAPNSPDVNAAMGYFLEKIGDTDKATYFYKKALSLAPNSGAQYNNYGAFLCRKGQYKEAEKFFIKAVDDVHYSHSAAAYENAGLCATAIPDYGKAMFYFKKALAEDPERKQSIAEVVQLEMKLNHPKKALKLVQDYRDQVLNDEVLLALAVNAAHQAGQFNVEETFKARLTRVNDTLKKMNSMSV